METETMECEIGERAAAQLGWENGWAAANVNNLLVRGWLSDASYARVALNRRQWAAHLATCSGFSATHRCTCP